MSFFSFAVIAVTDPSKLLVVGQVRHPLLAGEAVQQDTSRHLAFVASRKTSALHVIDVSQPSAPTVVGVIVS